MEKFKKAKEVVESLTSEDQVRKRVEEFGLSKEKKGLKKHHVSFLVLVLYITTMGACRAQDYIALIVVMLVVTPAFEIYETCYNKVREGQEEVRKELRKSYGTREAQILKEGNKKYKRLFMLGHYLDKQLAYKELLVERYNRTYKAWLWRRRKSIRIILERKAEYEQKRLEYIHTRILDRNRM